MFLVYVFLAIRNLAAKQCNIFFYWNNLPKKITCVQKDNKCWMYHFSNAWYFVFLVCLFCFFPLNYVDKAFSKQPLNNQTVKWKLLSHLQLFVTPWTVAHEALSVHGDSPGENTGVGSRSLLQGISRDRAQVSCIAGRFISIWATRQFQEYWRG